MATVTGDSKGENVKSTMIGSHSTRIFGVIYHTAVKDPATVRNEGNGNQRANCEVTTPPPS